MPLGSPYTACASSAAAGSATFQVTVTQSTSTGDAIVVALSSNATASAPTGVTDSQGNAYAQALLDTTRSPNLAFYVALNCTALASGTDWIKGAFAGTATVKALVARGCSGVVTASAVDKSVVADAGTGTSPSSGSTGTLALAAEWAVAGIANGASGGTPSSWTGGFTAVTTQGAGPFLTFADQVTASTAALTAGATIVSATWTCGTVTLKGARALTGTLPATVATSAGDANNPAKALPATVSTAGSLARTASRALAVTASTAGALARGASRALPVTVAPVAAVTRAIARVFAATTGTAGAVTPAIQVTVVQSAIGATSGLSPLTVTLLQPTGAGHTLVVCVTTYASTANPAVSGITAGASPDNFQPVAIPVPAGMFGGAIWYDPNCASGQTQVTVTFTGGSGAQAANYASVYEVASLLTADQSSASAGASTTVFTSGVTPQTTAAPEIAFGFATGSVSVPVVTGAGTWTTLGTGAGLFDQISGYQTLGAPGTAAFSGTIGSGSYVAMVATFAQQYTLQAVVTTAAALARRVQRTAAATVSAVASLLYKAPFQPAVITVTPAGPLAAAVGIAPGITAVITFTEET